MLLQDAIRLTHTLVVCACAGHRKHKGHEWSSADLDAAQCPSGMGSSSDLIDLCLICLLLQNVLSIPVWQRAEQCICAFLCRILIFIESHLIGRVCVEVLNTHSQR